MTPKYNIQITDIQITLQTFLNHPLVAHLYINNEMHKALAWVTPRIHNGESNNTPNLTYASCFTLRVEFHDKAGKSLNSLHLLCRRGA